MTNEAETGEPQEPTGYRRESAKRLDRDNLPDEFTFEFLHSLSTRDLRWLESEGDLTPRQREPLNAFVSGLPIGDATAEVPQGFIDTPAGWLFTAGTKNAGLRWLIPRVRGSDDQLGTEMQQTLDALTSKPPPIVARPTSIPPPEDDGVANRHSEQQQSMERLHDTNQQMVKLLAQLVQRTEQQHQAAERQKTTNWTLAVIAAASMAGTFATVDSVTYFWIAVIATFAVAGVLYVVMH